MGSRLYAFFFEKYVYRCTPLYFRYMLRPWFVRNFSNSESLLTMWLCLSSLTNAPRCVETDFYCGATTPQDSF